MTSDSNNDADSTQADAEGNEGDDKPPHVQPVIVPASSVVRPVNGVLPIKQTQQQAIVPPNSAYPRQLTLSSTSEKTVSSPNGGTAAFKPNNNNINGSLHTNGSLTPPSIDSPGGTMSGSEGWVSSPPTRNTSRAPSMSGGEQPIEIRIDQRHASITPKPIQKQPLKPLASPSHHQHPPPPPSSSAAATHSDAGGHKFNLRDLLGNSPNLVRRPSNRSASSRRSDSERGASSLADTSVSLAKKYGVCDRLAIGKGATSVVRLVHKWDRSEEKLYAVKEFRKRRKNETEKEYVKKLTAEFCISSTLHHPNIVETVDLVQDEQQHWCEVMEYCPGGDLYAAIKKRCMSTSEIECCFKQILFGVDYLHSQGVAHRDIKPENLFFDINGVLKIGDYGASTVYRLPWESTIHLSSGLCGSEPYIAPEQFSGKPYDARLVDIWACGIVYYCMSFQEMPWRVAQPSDATYATYAQAASTSKSDSAAGSCPAMINLLQPRGCRPVLRKMLEPDPKKRWNVKEIMANGWVQGIEVCTLTDKPSHVHTHARAMLQLHADKSTLIRKE